jgi:Protein of unknown function (DUF3618)
MGETPDDIRDEIEDTRARMGDTVEAIGYKADVPNRMKESVSEKKDSLIGSISGGASAVADKTDALVSRVGGAVPDGNQLKDGAAKVGVSKENPLGLVVAAAAIGFVLGTLLPATRVENEKLGEMSDELTDKAKEAGQEALDRGKSVAQDALQAAGETAQERGHEEAGAMSDSLQDKAHDIANDIE